MFRRHADAITAVLLDLTLPGLSSAEICAALRGRRPEVPIVLMSGYPEQQVAERLGGVVPAGFLPKPFTATQLQERILVALEGGARPGVGTRA